jgi:DNA-directed RNA polymerase specialized sigma24 family protein
MTGVSPLTQQSLERLLARLDTRGTRSAEEYERLRLRLIKFFEWRQCDPPDHFADETIDRLARKICQGRGVKNVYAYALGIARHVLSEHQQRRKEVPLEAGVLDALESANALQSQTSEMDELTRARHLEHQRHCLRLLSAEDRTLIAAYHAGAGSERTQHRRSLAAQLGIGMNALRIRVYRIRSWLIDCVNTLSGANACSLIPK